MKIHLLIQVLAPVLTLVSKVTASEQYHQQKQHQKRQRQQQSPLASNRRGRRRTRGAGVVITTSTKNSRRQRELGLKYHSDETNFNIGMLVKLKGDSDNVNIRRNGDYIARFRKRYTSKKSKKSARRKSVTKAPTKQSGNLRYNDVRKRNEPPTSTDEPQVVKDVASSLSPSPSSIKENQAENHTLLP